jgi:hypothetical protein
MGIAAKYIKGQQKFEFKKERAKQLKIICTNSRATRRKFFREIFPVESSSNNLNAFKIS